MPNWCNNSITISGPVETIQQLWTDAQEADGLLTAMVRPPENMFRGSLGTAEREQCAEQGIPNWYDWQVENWGTKWDVSLEGLEFFDNGDGTAYISGWFDSAWAPPIDAYNRFLDDMDNCSLEASYHEPGMDFAGFYTDGEEEHLDNLRDEYDAGDEASELYKRLDEEYGLSESFEMWDADEEMLEED